MTAKTELAKLEEMKRQLAEMAKRDASAEAATASSPFISLRNGIMTFNGQQLANNEIDCVILAAPIERQYYSGRFDPDNPRPPVCFALSRDPRDMVPSPASEDQQHQTCKGCPMDEWGSSEVSTKGKACKETRRLILLPVDAIESADSVKTSDIACLRPPVTSVKAFSTYTQTVAAAHSTPLFGVVTKIKVVPDAKTQFKLSFRAVNPVNLEVMTALMERADHELAVALASVNDATPAEEQESEPVVASDKY